MKPSVSIILPVYNVEAFLPKCLDTLLSQTLSNIEIIPVDDGSTDKSADIMKEYAKRDSRIKPIFQANQGTSGARNAGLEVASGEYIGFVDPDDWVDSQMYKVMYDTIEETRADLCVCDYNMAYHDRIIPSTLKLSRTSIQIEDYGLDKYWLEKKFSVVVWNKLYKKSIIHDYAIRFESHKEVFSEDVLFNLYYLLHIKTVVSVPDSFYSYYQRSNSLMRSVKPDYLEKELTLVGKFRSYYTNHKNEEEVNNILAGLLFDRVLDTCMNHLDANQTIGRIRSDLIYASKHDYFYKSMQKIVKDKRTWLPLRGFAFLSSHGQFLLSGCYLSTYYRATKWKKRSLSLLGASRA